ncbi:MAG: hypothetical protein CL930_06620 [Deltaproteobacteria bacterium]|nr:hypothetical protein [Deltaproteobacteria bacterium]
MGCIMNEQHANLVAAFISVDDDNRIHLPLALADLAQQRDLQFQILILDRTRAGLDLIAGTKVIPLGADISIGEAYRTGLKNTDADIIAWVTPGVRCLPKRLSKQRTSMALNPHIDLITSNLALIDNEGCLAAEANPFKADQAPTPFWQSGVMLRRSALTRIGQSQDLPVELFLYLRLKSQGRTSHIAAPLSVMPKTDFESRMGESLNDACAVRKVHPPIAPREDTWTQVRQNLDSHFLNQPAHLDQVERMIRDGSFDTDSAGKPTGG